MGDQRGDVTPPNYRGGWKVLIVDDVQDLRDSLRELLEGEGYAVIEAGDGPTALDILRTSRYPLVVLLDMMMPNMRGDSVIETLIKEHALPGKHAIVLITASPATLPRAIHSVLAKLEIPIARKPVPLDDIIELVEKASARIALQQSRSW